MKKKTGRVRVTGFGGIFFKARNQAKLREWYRRHLRLPLDPQWGGWQIFWRDPANPRKKSYAVWSVFARGNAYFGSSKQKFMINYRVDNLKKVLAALKREGVWVDPKTEESEFGKFGWARDGEGNRFELWEPPKGG